MNFKTSKIVKYVFLGAGVVAGCYLILIVEHYTEITFEPKLTLGDLANAGTALAVAILVTHYLEKHNKVVEHEKQILHEQLCSMSEILARFEVANESGQLIEITAALKRLRMACDTFVNSTKELKVDGKVFEQSNFDDLLSPLRKLSTETPIAGLEQQVKRSNCSATVKDNIIKLTAERKAQLDGKIAEFKLKIFKLRIAVNSY